MAPAKYVFKIPSNMSYQDGAALPMNFLTAYIMLFDIGNLQKGMSVFAHNIGGGVVSNVWAVEKMWSELAVSSISSSRQY